MTVIVAIPHNGRVYMGADTRATVGWAIHPMAETKVWNQDGVLFGASGHIREFQIIRHASTIPTLHEDADVMRWLCVDFVDALRTARKAAGFDTKMPDPTCEAGPSCLVGVGGRLFFLCSDYAVLEKRSAWAIGSGGAEAKGSLHTTERIRMSVRRRIDHALSAACDLDASCGTPFTYEHT